MLVRPGRRDYHKLQSHRDTGPFPGKESTMPIFRARLIAAALLLGLAACAAPAAAPAPGAPAAASAPTGASAAPRESAPAATPTARIPVRLAYTALVAS